MDYFQSPRQQQPNAGIASNQAAAQQQQHQQAAQQQQYHYNGQMASQQTSQSPANSQHLYYQQQMNSQTQQGQYFPIQPASATSPLDHGVQHPSTYHHGGNSHNGGGGHHQAQQQQHQQKHYQSIHQQQSLVQQTQQQQHAGGQHGATGAGQTATAGTNYSAYNQQHHQQSPAQNNQQRRQLNSLMSHQNQHVQHQGQQYHQQQQQHHGAHHHHHQSPQQHQNQQQQQHLQGGNGGGQQINNAQFFMGPGIGPGPLSHIEIPVRIVISSRHVGAVMGQGGSQIREITKESHAKVVVDSVKIGRKDAQETIINISGVPDCCTKAVGKILEVVNRELLKDENNVGADIELKMLAHNTVVGRLIGKQGATIKQLMAETETTITVTNEQQNREVPPQLQDYSQERSIVIHGPSIETVMAAESKISAKLRKCIEVDSHHRLQAFHGNLQGGNVLNQGLIPPGAAGSATGPYGLNAAAAAAAAAAASGTAPPFLGHNMKDLRMWVPDNMVGALIGSKGKNIKTIMAESGANVRVDAGEGRAKREASDESVEKKPEERHDLLEDGTGGEGEKAADPAASGDSSLEKSDEDAPVVEKKPEERMITLSGSDMQLLKAQSMIYAKIADQLPQAFEDLKLRTEMSVPSKIVGRIIGRGGQNVRELQRITGATVKIPEEDKSGDQDSVIKYEKDDDMTVVRIIGTIHASHNVQFRLSQLVVDHNRSLVEKKTSNLSGNGGGGGGDGDVSPFNANHSPTSNK